MKLWNTIAGKPYLVLALGAVLGGGVLAASTIKPSQTVIPAMATLKLRPVTLGTGDSAMSAARDVDAAMAQLADASSQAVVNIRNSKQNATAQGSGFVYTSDGYIITNDHVVGDNNVVYVTLRDGREFEGKVFRANDPQIDIAVVKVDGKDLPTLTLADSNGVKPGEFAIAVGSPFGLQNSVTIGHVSAIDRGGEQNGAMSVQDPTTGQSRGYTGMIQTDASINPGNSGGPLINVDGQVIGVNSTIFSMTGSNQGIGFSISSNVVKVVADKLIKTGKFQRGFMGAEIFDVKPYKLKEMGLRGGAQIGMIEPGKPAAQGGLKPDDVITSVDGQPVANQLDARIDLYKHNPGEKVTLTYLRSGQQGTAAVTLAAPDPVQPAQQQRRGRSLRDMFPDLKKDVPGPDFFPSDPNSEQAPATPHTGHATLGIQVQQLDDAARKQFNIPAGVDGVVVTTVAPGSFASKVGLQPGDLIKTVDGKPVKSAQALVDAMGKVNWGDQFSMNFSRFKDGQNLDQSIALPIN